MFGFGLKKRTAEAVRRGVRASFTGAYLHHSEVEALGFNEDASAWLFTEALAHHLYALGCVFMHSCAKDAWATYGFFADAAIDGMREAEADGNLDSKTLAPILLKRYADFEGMGAEGRLADEHYRSSALLVNARDESADVDQVTRLLKHSTMRYMDDVRKMF